MTWTPGPWTNPEPGVVESGGTWTFICPSVPDARLIAAAPEMADLLEALCFGWAHDQDVAGAMLEGERLLARIHGAEVTT